MRAAPVWLQLPREGETVTVLKSDLGNITCEEFSRYSVQDARTGEYHVSQVIDEDLDGELDYLLFQPDLEAGETRTYHLVADVDSGLLPVTDITTFSRFVPERTPSMSEVTVVDTESAVVVDRIIIPAANLLQGVA